MSINSLVKVVTVADSETERYPGMSHDICHSDRMKNGWRKEAFSTEDPPFCVSVNSKKELKKLSGG